METIKAFLLQWDLLGFTIAAIISLLVGLIYKGIKSFITMKRKPYNISRLTVNRTIYDNRNEGDFSITVSYKGKVYGEPLTLLRIRLLNDGENDINYIRQCARPLSIEIEESVEVIDVFLEPSNAEMGSTISDASKNEFDLSWSLMKKDEFIDLVIVAKGKNFVAEQVKMTLRAEGIEKIKSPEYRVWPQLWPMILAASIWATICWFFLPAKVTFIPGIQENVFWTGLALFMIPLYTVLLLIKRIKWQKE